MAKNPKTSESNIIKGTVTRVVSDTNFFFRPENEEEVRHIDVDGHRVGDGELCTEKGLGARKAKLKYSGLPPAIGDTVEVEIV